MNKKSITSCDVCEAKMKEKDDACCKFDEINQRDETNTKITQSECCVNLTSVLKIEDNLLTPSKEKNLPYQIISFIEIVNEDLNLDSQKIFNSTNFDLPPPISGKKLLQNIHQLKIALPAC
jgi:hypothetical protein